MMWLKKREEGSFDRPPALATETSGGDTVRKFARWLEDTIAECMRWA